MNDPGTGRETHLDNSWLEPQQEAGGGSSWGVSMPCFSIFEQAQDQADVSLFFILFFSSLAATSFGIWEVGAREVGATPEPAPLHCSTPCESLGLPLNSQSLVSFSKIWVEHGTGQVVHIQ